MKTSENEYLNNIAVIGLNNLIFFCYLIILGGCEVLHMSPQHKDTVLAKNIETLEENVMEK